MPSRITDTCQIGYICFGQMAAIQAILAQSPPFAEMRSSVGKMARTKNPAHGQVFSFPGSGGRFCSVPTGRQAKKAIAGSGSPGEKAATELKNSSYLVKSFNIATNSGSRTPDKYLISAPPAVDT